MLEPRRIEMDVQPDLIEKLGNGTYYYNYDIKSKEVNVTDPETEDVTQETRWTYVQVHLHGQPDHKECLCIRVNPPFLLKISSIEKISST